MKRLHLLALVFTVSLYPSAGFGADETQPAQAAMAESKQDLQKARTDYQQAVSQYGQESAEAREARESLRESRQTFHEEIRRSVSSPASQPSTEQAPQSGN